MAIRVFEGKVVVVTGGASGIGLAIAREFGENGAKTVLLDLDKKTLDGKVEELKRNKIDAMGVVCDVTDEAGCRAAVRKVIENFGGIDLLVNNAGITQRSGFLNTEVSVYRRVMDINFFGSVICTKAAIESIVERKGMIIAVTSIAGLAPLLGRTGYAASKHAMHGFFTSLRTELKRYGVDVMIVCPGFTKTNLQTRALDGDGTVTKHPQSTTGRQYEPEEIAKAVYRGAVKRKRLLVLSLVGKFTHLLNKVAPGLYERIMVRKMSSELDR
ncbi:MAG: SDR family oxidoreductase [Deltaproteobacteria bacterium]|uniref:SDR family oxidoreductase n=1 Tax=Candidatus Zymogenus saltonus TaxID=2844893 RepID=A0A9D8KEU1_9DELT|nr:SDR family oxidoreductase [Candidatus Zymogenus saltonus]